MMYTGTKKEIDELFETLPGNETIRMKSDGYKKSSELQGFFEGLRCNLKDEDKEFKENISSTILGMRIWNFYHDS